jgi:hypothetical protein
MDCVLALSKLNKRSDGHHMKLMQRCVLKKCCIAGVCSVLSGCAGLLPDAKEDTRTPWHSYADAQAMFDSIVPYTTTTAELKASGIDPEKTPNVAVLSHADLLRKIVAGSSIDIRLFDLEMQSCLTENKSCVAYEIEQTHLDRQRIGNFLVDFLNFHRHVDISGWQFDAIVVVRNARVIYKLWSGKPNIHQSTDERNPLGPLQGIGGSLLRP